MIDATGSHKDEIEYGEKSQLEGECAISNFPESEAAKERSKDVKNNFIPHVILEIKKLVHEAR